MIPKVLDLYLGYIILIPFIAGLTLYDPTYYLLVIPQIWMYHKQNGLIKLYYWKVHGPKNNTLRKAHKNKR